MIDPLIPDFDAWKLVVPEEQRLEVFKEAHSEKKRAIWPAGLMGQRIVEQTWTVVATDMMGPFPRSKSGHKYVLVFQGLFTK